MKPISDLRKDYTKATLDSNSVNKNPITQFELWFNEAVKSDIKEANAMVLSTLSEGGTPSARLVLLKGIEANKFIFYTNYQSQKARELDKNGACALTFFWPELERQVRIEGLAERVDNAASEKYFQSRPRPSQVGAWASPQSAVIKDRLILEERVKEVEKKYEGFNVLPKPHQWGGYSVTPFEIEFWQGRASRLHDRILYTLIDGSWQINRLAP